MIHVKASARLLPLALAGLLSPLPAQLAPSLQFLTPRDGQVVWGTNLLLWAREIGSPLASARPVVFSASTDQTNFLPLPARPAPDFSPDGRGTAVDTTAFPSGPLWLRVSFEGGQGADTVQVRVNRLPQPSCRAQQPQPLPLVLFDCSLSVDPDGTIESYRWDFGDGHVETTLTPALQHLYPAFGSYTFRLTVTDNLGGSVTLLRTVESTPSAVYLSSLSTCGCESMIVRAKGDSAFFGDPRRTLFPPIPLGLDPDFLSFNFEVVAHLVPGSDPSLCTEGQNVARTATSGGKKYHKMACTKGLDLPSCRAAADCSAFLCNGGTQNGRSCAQHSERVACGQGGGACDFVQGECTAFPFGSRLDPFPPVQGNDGYRSEYDLGSKKHCSTCASPSVVWADTPGARTILRTDMKDAFVWDANFHAFVEGPAGSCHCRLDMRIDWDGMKMNDGTGMGLLPFSSNCTLEQ